MAKKPAVQADNDAPVRAPAADAVKGINFAKFLRAEKQLADDKAEHKDTLSHVDGKINLKAAKIVAKIISKGPAEQSAFMTLIRDVLELMEIAGTPVPREQIEMFPGEEERTPAEERARKAGRNAAFFDKGTGDNPYDPGSSLGQAWLVGLSEGRAEVDLIMALASDELIKGAASEEDPFEEPRVAAE